MLISITNFQLVSTFFLVFPTGFQQFPMFSDWFLMVSNDFQLVSVVSSGLPQSPMVLRPDVGYQCWVSQSNRPRAALGTHAQPNHLTFKVQLCVWPSLCGSESTCVAVLLYGFARQALVSKGHSELRKGQFGFIWHRFGINLVSFFCRFDHTFLFIFWVIFGCFYRYL